jgi:hypothetical protein
MRILRLGGKWVWSPQEAIQWGTNRMSQLAKMNPSHAHSRAERRQRLQIDDAPRSWAIISLNLKTHRRGRIYMGLLHGRYDVVSDILIKV